MSDGTCQSVQLLGTLWQVVPGGMVEETEGPTQVLGRSDQKTV